MKTDRFARREKVKRLKRRPQRRRGGQKGRRGEEEEGEGSGDAKTEREKRLVCTGFTRGIIWARLRRKKKRIP